MHLAFSRGAFRQTPSVHRRGGDVVPFPPRRRGGPIRGDVGGTGARFRPLGKGSDGVSIFSENSNQAKQFFIAARGRVLLQGRTFLGIRASGPTIGQSSLTGGPSCARKRGKGGLGIRVGVGVGAGRGWEGEEFVGCFAPSPLLDPQGAGGI